MLERASYLIADRRGAVAPTIALSLFALVAIGGVGFDYARMASMDTELQNAADQAALAAASQLDGQDDACQRAADAARSMIANQTLMANETAGTNAITIASETACDAVGNVRFYQDIAKTKPATADENAKFVEVQVDPRTAFYALTPIVSAFSSGAMTAVAFAGLGEAICNTPPVMMCNPAEPNGNIDKNLPFSAAAGDGIRLVIGSADTPGNFGFLQTGFGTGAADLAKALGYDTPPADCAAATGVSIEPGDKDSVRAAFNTRFDLSESGQTCPGTGTCSPSRNSRKDLVKGNVCSTSGVQAWREAANPYRPTSATTPLDGTNDPEIMGYPRDMCHAVSLNGDCDDGAIGDGEWDRDAYFRVNYDWTPAQWATNTGLDDDATRYEVYEWELNNPDQSDQAKVVGGGKTGYSYPVCRPPGITPSATTPDRRRIPMAVVNCEAHGLAGRENNVTVLQWADVFLVEPAFPRGSGPSARTGNGDVYVELIGETTTASSSTGSLQAVKKAVPYLIE